MFARTSRTWDESLHIYTFAAAESGRGYGTAALGELRELAGNRRVIVFAIGDEGSESHSWWTHQKAVGRVQFPFWNVSVPLPSQV